MTWSIAAALAVLLAVLLHDGAETRLDRLDGRAGGSVEAAGGRRAGIGAELAGLAAALRAGHDMPSSLEHRFGTDARCMERKRPTFIPDGDVTDCNGGIDIARLADVLRVRALPDETEDEVRYAASGLRAACALGIRVGCPMARCVEAVRMAHARIHMREELKRNAFAVPQSTVKMLLGLPAVTVILGEVLGADPLGVLFGSWQGMCCLVLGAMCHAAGAVWMRRLMARMEAGDD